MNKFLKDNKNVLIIFTITVAVLIISYFAYRYINTPQSTTSSTSASPSTTSSTSSTSASPSTTSYTPPPSTYLAPSTTQPPAAAVLPTPASTSRLSNIQPSLTQFLSIPLNQASSVQLGSINEFNYVTCHNKLWNSNVGLEIDFRQVRETSDFVFYLYSSSNHSGTFTIKTPNTPNGISYPQTSNQGTASCIKIVISPTYVINVNVVPINSVFSNYVPNPPPS